MGQLFFTDQNGRRWMCGWDNPSGGYYASREGIGPDSDDFDILIGFGEGIPDLYSFSMETRRHDFVLTIRQELELVADRQRQERPLTPLQNMIRGIMSELEAEGKL